MTAMRRGILGALALIGIIVAIPFVTGPTAAYERSLICNLDGVALDQPNLPLDSERSQCVVRELVDNRYCIVCEFVRYIGSTNGSEPDAAPLILSRIEDGQTAFSPGYAQFCRNVFDPVFASQRSESRQIARADTRDEFPLTCPAEEARDAA